MLPPAGAAFQVQQLERIRLASDWQKLNGECVAAHNGLSIGLEDPTCCCAWGFSCMCLMDAV